MDEAFFRQRYEADPANKGKQSWGDYQGWVKRFYEGQKFPPIAGWNGREQDILKGIPAPRQAEAKPVLETVGKVLAAEWAKDNSVRKVSTSDLQTWGSQFKDAAKDPEKLLVALRQVETEVKRRTGGA